MPSLPTSGGEHYPVRGPRRRKVRLLLLSLLSHLQNTSTSIHTQMVAWQTYQVKRRAGLEPLDLSLVERVSEGDLLLGAICVLQDEGQVLAGRERLESEDVNLVAGLNLLVVVGVDKRQREHTLLLQVGLVDTGERAGDDGKAAEETGFEGCVLTRGTFTVVVVADDNPLDATVTVVRSGSRNSAEFTSDLVLDFVSLAVLRVDGTNQAVL